MHARRHTRIHAHEHIHTQRHTLSVSLCPFCCPPFCSLIQKYAYCTGDGACEYSCCPPPPKPMASVACTAEGRTFMCADLPNSDGEACTYMHVMGAADCSQCHKCPGGWIMGRTWYGEQGWPPQCPTPLDDKGLHLAPMKDADWALCGLPAPGQVAASGSGSGSGSSSGSGSGSGGMVGCTADDPAATVHSAIDGSGEWFGDCTDFGIEGSFEGTCVARGACTTCCATCAAECAAAGVSTDN